MQSILEDTFHCKQCKNTFRLDEGVLCNQVGIFVDKYILLCPKCGYVVKDGVNIPNNSNLNFADYGKNIQKEV